MHFTLHAAVPDLAVRAAPRPLPPGPPGHGVDDAGLPGPAARPTAPPRLSPGSSTPATVPRVGLRHGLPFDHLSAMPSVHVAWGVLVGWYVWRCSPEPVAVHRAAHATLTTLLRRAHRQPLVAGRHRRRRHPRALRVGRVRRADAWQAAWRQWVTRAAAEDRPRDSSDVPLDVERRRPGACFARDVISVSGDRAATGPFLSRTRDRPSLSAPAPYWSGSSSCATSGRPTCRSSCAPRGRCRPASRPMPIPGRRRCGPATPSSTRTSTAWPFLPLAALPAVAGLGRLLRAGRARRGQRRCGWPSDAHAGPVPYVVALTLEPVVRALQLGTLNPLLLLGLAVAWRFRRSPRRCVVVALVVGDRRQVVPAAHARLARAAPDAGGRREPRPGCPPAPWLARLHPRALRPRDLRPHAVHPVRPRGTCTARRWRPTCSASAPRVASRSASRWPWRPSPWRSATGWPSRTGREVYTFSACLIASLVLSPIVWGHYFALLVIIPLVLGWRRSTLVVTLVGLVDAQHARRVPALQSAHRFRDAGLVWGAGAATLFDQPDGVERRSSSRTRRRPHGSRSSDWPGDRRRSPK